MYHIIINPASRSGKGEKIWKDKVEPALLRDGAAYRSYFSQKVGDVTKITARILSEATEFPVTLIVLGGDGTVNEVLQGISDTSRVILGYIPTGSSNDLARDLNIPENPTDALNLILHSHHVCPMDLGTVTYSDGTNRRFAVSCGIGYDAAVCEEAIHSKMKSVLNRLGLGKLTYLGIALKQLLTAKPISGKLILDDEAPIDIGRILFTASMLHRYEGGGFMFCPAARDNDGILDLCAVGDVSKVLILFALPTAFFGKHYRFKGITPYRAKKVTIETSTPLWVHTDGEVFGKSDRITITCEQNGINIIKP